MKRWVGLGSPYWRCETQNSATFEMYQTQGVWPCESCTVNIMPLWRAGVQISDSGKPGLRDNFSCLRNIGQPPYLRPFCPDWTYFCHVVQFSWPLDLLIFSRYLKAVLRRSGPLLHCPPGRSPFRCLVSVDTFFVDIHGCLLKADSVRTAVLCFNSLSGTFCVRGGAFLAEHWGSVAFS